MESQEFLVTAGRQGMCKHCVCYDLWREQLCYKIMWEIASGGQVNEMC